MSLLEHRLALLVLVKPSDISNTDDLLQHRSLNHAIHNIAHEVFTFLFTL